VLGDYRISNEMLNTDIHVCFRPFLIVPCLRGLW
jgi:hypothetical protein